MGFVSDDDQVGGQGLLNFEYITTDRGKADWQNHGSGEDGLRRSVLTR